MLFLGMANAYVMRTNMSVAIVAMVNHTALTDQDEHDVLTNECGDEPNATAAAVVSRTISHGLNFIHNTGKFVEKSVHVIDRCFIQIRFVGSSIFHYIGPILTRVDSVNSALLVPSTARKLALVKS